MKLITAYCTIIEAEYNAGIIHYPTHNNIFVYDGDLILVDADCE